MGDPGPISGNVIHVHLFVEALAVLVAFFSHFVSWGQVSIKLFGKETVCEGNLIKC